MTLFTLVFVIAAAVEAGFFVYQLRLKRQVMRAAEKAAATAREVATEKRALLVRLNEYDLAYELLRSIANASEET